MASAFEAVRLIVCIIRNRRANASRHQVFAPSHREGMHLNRIVDRLQIRHEAGKAIKSGKLQGYP
ncbi:MAG: hypothetical protein AB7I42_08115 [Bradyrhizobium sp.]|uniref:hypothetical protein n=1 Tax=Bradyrhizobium sp. TaxID=376 RepID=UPI002A2E0FA8|nr:hypothetical protein [Bradyrhizobium sp.]